MSSHPEESKVGSGPVLGLDVGTECVKAVMLDKDGAIMARTSTSTQGYFESCIEQVMKAVLEEAKIDREDLSSVLATGFGSRCVSEATGTVPGSTAHAAGAWLHNPHEMTVLDIGGREIRAISVSEDGTRIGSRGGRKCVAGIGSFLIFAARHLDVHPTRMQELAAEASSPAVISSFCSVFSSNELLERLRDGTSREDIALGCMRAISERVLELGTDWNPDGIDSMDLALPEWLPWGRNYELRVISLWDSSLMARVPITIIDPRNTAGFWRGYW